MTDTPSIAVIGGSGFYNIPSIKDTETIEVDTPFGKPSSPIFTGTLAGKRIAFLARHGIGHHISPSEVNYRANIYALKSLGVRNIISVSACGSLREDYAPGHIVIPDQLFDFTRGGRLRSFFDEGMVAHVSVAEPFCKELSQQVYKSVQKAGATAHLGGTFITIEGPRFSTRAESNLFRAWGMSIIGMTTSPEAFLAREAEMCYAVMAHVTDYDVWHINEQPVTVEMVIRTLQKNTEVAQQAILYLLEDLQDNNCCDNALSDSLITHHSHISEKAKSKLELLIGKYIKK